MEIRNFYKENLRMLIKIKEKFLYFKSFLLCLIVVCLIISLFYLKIPLNINLEGSVKCNKKECNFTVIATSNIEKYSDNFKEITFKEKDEIKKISYSEPYVLNNVLVSNMIITVSNKELKNNQVAKGVITVKEDTIFSLFLSSLKGGDANDEK